MPLIVGVIVLLGLLIGGFFALKATGVIGGTQVKATSMPTTEVAIVQPTEATENQPTVEQPTVAPTTEPTAETSPVATEAAVVTPIGRGGKVAFVSNRAGDGYNQVLDDGCRY